MAATASRWERMSGGDRMRFQGLAMSVISNGLQVGFESPEADVAEFFSEEGFCLRPGKTPLDFLITVEDVEREEKACEVELVASRLAEVVRFKEA